MGSVYVCACMHCACDVFPDPRTYPHGFGEAVYERVFTAGCPGIHNALGKCAGCIGDPVGPHADNEDANIKLMFEVPLGDSWDDVFNSVLHSSLHACVSSHVHACDIALRHHITRLSQAEMIPLIRWLAKNPTLCLPASWPVDWLPLG